MSDSAERKLVRYEVREGVAYLTLDDPPFNGYTHEMMKDLDAGILAARFDPEVHVIVLAGEGEKFFCAGANINMLKASDPTFKYYFCLHANETLSRLEQTPKLVVAALEGHTVGGGLEIAMAADIRIAKRDPKSKVGLPEVNLGVLPGTGGTQRFARIVGKSKAIEMMTIGNLISFEDAEGLGIIDRIFDGDDFMGQIHAYARQFCPPNKSSKVVGRIKRSVQSGLEIPFESALAIERELQQILFQGEDAKEGLAAYIDKRAPQFKGA
ncbi:MAG TPA: enoyl-CoA hydratase/isomerase family protein [Thermoanaerobaculia bacterium]|jgi:enoyl-CoA hydratase/carnithine racemase|nr:enoyl-CoA hydratase/isomerase family protein [Thermoanaerobaculia bacterium]HXU33872.1 enoyl-CoA hydratase/isomerase family protein [Thermoanaerobaculia bacterium]